MWWNKRIQIRRLELRKSTWTTAAAAAKSLPSCPTLCDPIEGSPLGSSVPGILQARTLESAAISFSNAWKWKVKVRLLSHVRLLATPWTAAYQVPPSMGFSRQEYWSGLPLPSPRKQNAAAVKSLPSCPTLCDPIDGSPPGSPVPGILQARTLEWVLLYKILKKETVVGRHHYIQNTETFNKSSHPSIYPSTHHPSIYGKVISAPCNV